MVRLFLASPAFVALVACATPPREYTDPRPMPTPEQRAAFGTIGIAPAGAASPSKPNAPTSRSNLEKAGMTAGGGVLGAGFGALWGLGCGPWAIICVPAFAAAGGAAGLAAGAAETLPYGTEEQVNNADITLRNAVLSIDIEDRLVATVLAQAARTPGRNLRRVGYSMQSESWDLGAFEEEIDTRILLAASKVSLVPLNPNQRANPDVRLEIVVDGQIFEAGQEAPSFERRWLYDSEVHNYFDWADEQGVLVITEINRAIAVLGARIAADFLAGQHQAIPQPYVEEQVQADLAALKDSEMRGPAPATGSAAAQPPAGPRGEAGATAARKLRVAVFPFAGGPNAGHIAEAELEDYAHRYVRQRRELALVYSAYDDDFDSGGVGHADSLWSGGFVSKSPSEANVYRAAAALDADVVLMFFVKNRTGGWYSEGQYAFDLYLLDVRQRRLYRGSGDERSVREVLESVFWQLETGRVAS